MTEQHTPFKTTWGNLYEDRRDRGASHVLLDDVVIDTSARSTWKEPHGPRLEMHWFPTTGELVAAPMGLESLDASIWVVGTCATYKQAAWLLDQSEGSLGGNFRLDRLLDAATKMQRRNQNTLFKGLGYMHPLPPAHAAGFVGAMSEAVETIGEPAWWGTDRPWQLTRVDRRDHEALVLRSVGDREISEIDLGRFGSPDQVRESVRGWQNWSHHEFGRMWLAERLQVAEAVGRRRADAMRFDATLSKSFDVPDRRVFENPGKPNVTMVRTTFEEVPGIILVEGRAVEDPEVWDDYMPEGARFHFVGLGESSKINAVYSSRPANLASFWTALTKVEWGGDPSFELPGIREMHTQGLASLDSWL